MKKILIIFSAMAGIALAASAFAEDLTENAVSSESQSKTEIEKDASGNYYKKRTTSTESVDAEGTRSSTQTKVKVDVDASGNEEKSITTETVTDPKGLMNKTKTVTTDSVKNKDGKSEIVHEKKVNGTTVELNREEVNNTAN